MSKRAKVREMEYSIDESDEHLGMTRIDLEPERTPAERLPPRSLNNTNTRIRRTATVPISNGGSCPTPSPSAR